MTATLTKPATVHTEDTVNTTGRPQTAALAATRVVVSFLFVCHGFQRLFGAFGGIDGQGGVLPFGAWPG